MKKILYIIVVLILGLHEAHAIENNCPNPNIADVFYADGTCSANYIPSKNAIGIIYWLGAKKKGGLIMGLHTLAWSWSDAIDYCKDYIEHGVTGWKLPVIGELIPMGEEMPYNVGNDKFNILNAKLASVGGRSQYNRGYWSASEDHMLTDYATTFYPLHAGIGGSEKISDDYLYARCVLAF